MISISDIKAGWAVLNIGYCCFEVSYLSNLIEELDYLFDLPDDMSVKKVELEGESQGELSLVAHLTFGNVNDYLPSIAHRVDDEYDRIINIIFQRTFCSMEDSITIMKFPYKEFLEEYLSFRNNDEFLEDYIKNFMIPIDKAEHNKLKKELKGEKK